MLQSDVERFLAEDLGEWDDSNRIVPEVEAQAYILAREECAISGLMEAARILDYLHLAHEALFDEGEFVPAGAVVMSIRGSARQILRGERLVLNILSRMSGITSITRECALKAGGTKVACTRKTTPGFRFYEKRAVMAGGGDPHRYNLSGALMIKDNHIKLLGLEQAIASAKKAASFTKRIEVEVEDLDQMTRAAELGVDIIMFDNMPPSEIRAGVERLTIMGLRDRVILEASGGITPQNVGQFATTGVDVVSLGALTREARWIDFSLEMAE
ncbi:MAG: carboxylating nicotinate-nucleotide diphosphorylase [Methanosarcinales archaeon]|nr:carboxylating nicotinate-nucleotide diphosphorylase [Methanosarcinales archaeon]